MKLPHMPTATRRFVESFVLVLGASAVLGGQEIAAELSQCTAPHAPGVVCTIAWRHVGLLFATGTLTGAIRVLKGWLDDAQIAANAPTLVSTTPTDSAGSPVGVTTHAIETPVEPTPPSVPPPPAPVAAEASADARPSPHPRGHA